VILVDTSVWVEHLRKGSPALKELLQKGLVLVHPFVIGELACGNVQNRDEIMRLLQSLPRAKQAENEEVCHILEQGKLYGRGLGWIDVHLLASVLISGCGLWTLDRRLHRVADELCISSP